MTLTSFDDSNVTTSPILPTNTQPPSLVSPPNNGIKNRARILKICFGVIFPVLAILTACLLWLLCTKRGKNIAKKWKSHEWEFRLAALGDQRAPKQGTLEKFVRNTFVASEADVRAIANTISVRRSLVSDYTLTCSPSGEKVDRETTDESVSVLETLDNGLPHSPDHPSSSGNTVKTTSTPHTPGPTSAV